MERMCDEMQQRIIEIERGRHLVLAPPGCGKTHILAHRIMRALQRGLHPEKMLCLTFTNRAARGMRTRIAQFVERGAEDIFVGNVHRYCSNLLFGQGVLSLRTAIIDDYDITDILQGICTRSVDGFPGVHYVPNYQHFMMQLRLGVENDLMLHIATLPYKLELRQLCNHMGMAYSRQSVLHIYYHQDEVPESVASHYKGLMLLMQFALSYERYKEQHSMVDFDDILILAYVHLRDQEHVRYPWIQIDEVQDLNPMQLTIVDLLYQEDTEKGTLIYLGDEQQAIFSFIGAKMATIEHLKQVCADSIHRLSKNYRAPQHLLNLYNDFAEKQLGVDRALLPTTDFVMPGDTTDCIRVCVSESSDDEFENIATHLVPTLTSREGETTAIIVPTNSDADKVSALLSTTPHFKISGQDMFMHPHMKALLSHFSIVHNEHNVLAWAHIFRQLGVEPSYAMSRASVVRLFGEGMVPSDFLRYEGETYVTQFCKAWDEQTFVVYDTETTGTDVLNDDIVQLAAFKVRGGKKIEGSDFEVLLHTDREIPAMLGEIVNPLVEEYARRSKMERSKGLSRFVEYAEGSVLCGHNVKFDNAILFNNLERCGISHNLPLRPTEGTQRYFSEVFDTLVLARRLFPQLCSYRLKNLLEQLELSGENSHLASDDIWATYQLLLKCRAEAQERMARHYQLLSSPEIQRIAKRLTQGYVVAYYHALQAMSASRTELSPTLMEEMAFVAEEMKLSIPKFDLILDFMSLDVVNLAATPTFAEQLNRHILDLSSYRETDLCDSECMRQRGEKLFVSTVHKAKGLEFDNVVVTGVVDSVYPFYRSVSNEDKMEDARKFYVALSRAKKRIYLCHYRFHSFVDRSGTSRTFSRTISPFCYCINHHLKPLNFI